MSRKLVESLCVFAFIVIFISVTLFSLSSCNLDWIGRSKVPDGRIYIESFADQPQADAAILPLFIRFSPTLSFFPMYSFDACLRHGFHSTSVALSEAFSSATLAHPGAVEEAAFQISRHENIDLREIDKSKKVKTIFDQACADLNVKQLYLASLFYDEKKAELLVQAYDCGKKKTTWEQSIDYSSMSPEGMEAAELEASLIVSRKIVNDYSGDFGFIDDGPGGEGKESVLLVKGKEYFFKGDPFSLMKSIEIFSQAAASNPRNPEAWSWLSEGWTTLGFYFKDVPSLADPYWVKGYSSAKTALALDPKNAHANRAAAWIYSLTRREYRGKKLLDKSIEKNPEDSWALSIKSWLEGNGDELKSELRNNPGRDFIRLLLADISKDEKAGKIYADMYDSKINFRPWLPSRMKDIFCESSNFIEGMSFYLNVIESSSRLGEELISESEDMWKDGGWPIAPDIENLVRKNFKDKPWDRVTEHSQKKQLEEDGDKYTTIKKDHERNRDWLIEILEEPGRHRDRRLLSLTTTPFSVLEFLDGVSLLGALRHLDMLKKISWQKQKEESIAELKKLYPKSPEIIAFEIHHLVYAKDYKGVEALIKTYTKRNGDNRILNNAIMDYCVKFASKATAYQERRMPSIWPLDYLLNMRLARRLRHSTPRYRFRNAINAALAADPESEDAIRLKNSALATDAIYNDSLRKEIVFLNDEPKNLETIDMKIQSYERRINESSGVYKNYNWLSTYYLRKSDFENAERTMKRKLRIVESPISRNSVLVAIADIYLNQGMNEEALSYYRQAAETSMQQDALLGLARGFNGVGEYERSDVAFKQAIERYPKSSGNYRDWGYALLERGEIEGAEKMALKAVEMYPVHENRQLLFRVRIKQDNTDSIQNFYPEKMQHKMKLMVVLDLGAWAIYGKNDLKLAKEIADESSQMFKRSAADDMLLMEIEAFSHDYDMAMTYVEALKKNGDIALMPEYMAYRYISIMLETNNIKEAESAAKCIYQSDLNTPLDHMSAALIAIKKRKMKDAGRHIKIFSEAANLSRNILLDFQRAELCLLFAQKSRKKEDRFLAIKAIERVKMTSDQPWILDFYLARCHELMKDRKKAKALYKQALEFAPGFTRARERLDKL